MLRYLSSTPPSPKSFQLVLTALTGGLIRRTPRIPHPGFSVHGYERTERPRCIPYFFCDRTALNSDKIANHNVRNNGPDNRIIWSREPQLHL
jgi:hypothetical protein